MHHRIEFCAAFAAAVLVLVPILSAQAQQGRPTGLWSSQGTEDCTGKDWASSDGLLPEGAKCSTETNGRIAVCWDGVNHKNPSRAGAWCTYKTVQPNECRGGSNPGVMYQCRATVVSAPPPVAVPAPSAAALGVTAPGAQGAPGWVPRGFGDCTASDWASTDGLQVDAAKCAPQTAGRVAVCWNGVTYKNPSRAGAWCTYKTVPLERCQGGSSPGYLFECRTDAASLLPPPGTGAPVPGAPVPGAAAGIPPLPPPLAGVGSTPAAPPPGIALAPPEKAYVPPPAASGATPPAGSAVPPPPPPPPGPVASAPPAVPQATPGGSPLAADHRGENGRRFSYACAPGFNLGRVWGTGIYTDDSDVCMAAIHAGLISAAAGGTVVIEIRPGQASYAGSTRNGVASNEFGSWLGSFVVIGGTAVAGATPPAGSAVPPPPPPPPPGPVAAAPPPAAAPVPAPPAPPPPSVAQAPVPPSPGAVPEMATTVFVGPAKFEECKGRLSVVLTQHGYGGWLDFGNGWIGFSPRHSASLGCIADIPGGTAVVMTTAGGGALDEVYRLQASFRGQPQPQPQPPPQPRASTMSFANPTFNGYPVSNCLNFGGVGCGQQAADRFCQSSGYSRATQYKVAYGGTPWIWDIGKACDDPGCAKLVDVACVR